MNMVRLIYVSHFNGSANPNDIQDILAISRENNAKWGITGALCYDPNYFLQCLEGPRDRVNRLYRQIICDERHQEITLLEYCDIHARKFEQWSMAHARIDDLTESIILRYSANKKFSPFSMTAKQALGFIEDMAKERQEHLAQEAKRLFKVPRSHAHA